MRVCGDVVGRPPAASVSGVGPAVRVRRPRGNAHKHGLTLFPTFYFQGSAFAPLPPSFTSLYRAQDGSAPRFLAHRERPGGTRDHFLCLLRLQGPEHWDRWRPKPSAPAAGAGRPESVCRVRGSCGNSARVPGRLSHPSWRDPHRPPPPMPLEAPACLCLEFPIPESTVVISRGFLYRLGPN